MEKTKIKKHLFKRTVASVMACLCIGVAPAIEANAATAIRPSQIIEHAEKLSGSSYPRKACLTFVVEFFSDLGADVTSACCSNSYGSKIISSDSMSDIPVGADIFFNGSDKYCGDCGRRCGHIAIYIGNGEVVHAWSGMIKRSSVDYILSCGYSFRGWGFHGGVKVTDDVTPPEISNLSVSKLTAKGYLVKCTVTDNKDLDSVVFTTWTNSDGNDDVVRQKARIRGNTASVYVKVSDHFYESGKYTTYVYASDSQDNVSSDSITLEVPRDPKAEEGISDIQLEQLKLTCMSSFTSDNKAI